MSQLPPHVTDEFYSELVGNLQTFGFCDDEESKTARMSVQHGTRCCSLPTACHAYTYTRINTYTNLHDSHAACPPLPLPTQRRSTRPARRAGTSSLTKTAPCSSGTTYDHPILPARTPLSGTQCLLSRMSRMVAASPQLRPLGHICSKPHPLAR